MKQGAKDAKFKVSLTKSKLSIYIGFTLDSNVIST